MDSDLIVIWLIAAGGGFLAGLLGAWSILFSLKLRVYRLEREITREVKTRAAQTRWERQPSLEAQAREILQAQGGNGGHLTVPEILARARGRSGISSSGDRS